MDRPDPGHMNGYYSRPYSTDDMRRLAQMNGQNAIMGIMGPAAMSGGDLIEGQTLDDIISQNNKEEQRRRSMQQQQQQQHYGASRSNTQGDMRRSSMLEFGSPLRGDLDSFQFDPSSVSISSSLPRGASIAQRRAENQHARKRQSQESPGLNTQFSDIGPGFENLTQSPVYQHNLNASDPMSMASNNFMSQNMPMDMDYVEGLDVQNHDMTPINFFPQDTYDPDLVASPILQNIPESMRGPSQDPGGGNGMVQSGDEAMMKNLPRMNLGETMHSRREHLSAEAPTPENRALLRTQDSLSSAQGPTTDSLSNALSNEERPELYRNTFTTAEPLPGQPAPPTSVPQYKNVYSSSGFDMLGVLMRVATRPNPQISIGAVDMACAFVVCDVTQHDIPIVYCSDMFERLTGYSKHEILGRNCRFLQAPDGKVQSGVKRKYVDDSAIFHLKSMIESLSEAQISVINYRKGGQPFMNLLTMIPITYDSDEIKYYVGFQVDLVEQPTSITNKNSDGSYAINYQRDLLPRYVFTSRDTNGQRDPELGQTIGRDDVSTVLSTIGSGESELSKRIWDKVLLENTDDVVHVLSLKGLFLYLSPSSRKVLEYEPHELVGTALSSVCHPSDIVPVTRELKDTSAGVSVSVVFRIRRKNSGYTWFESHGALHTEQGKGKKCIILVGRQRPVYALARNDINASGGIGEGEIWMKMSTSGMFLFVSSNVRLLLDRTPDELVGTTAHLLLRPDSKAEFSRMLEKARTGVRATLKHDINHKRGHTVQAQTTIYPGDADEGQKPTFLVAQIRILKLARNTVPVPPKPSSKSGSETPSTNVSGGSQNSQTSPPQTSPAAPSQIPEAGVVTQPGGSGLAIGSQHEALASEDNVFDELKTTRSTSWQFELRQMEKRNRLLAEELQSLLSNRKKRKRRKGAGNLQKDCANCHTRSTPEWRRGPSGNRDLCNSCGLRWAKQNGRISSRTSSGGPSDKRSTSPTQSSPILPFSSVPPSTIPGPPYTSHNANQPTLDRPASTIDPSSISIPKPPPHQNNLPYPQQSSQPSQTQTSPQQPQPPPPILLPPQLPPPTQPPLYPNPATLNQTATNAARLQSGANLPPNGAAYHPYTSMGQMPRYPGAAQADFAEAKPPHVTQASRGIGFGGPGQGGGSLNMGRPAKIEEGDEY